MHIFGQVGAIITKGNAFTDPHPSVPLLPFICPQITLVACVHVVLILPIPSLGRRQQQLVSLFVCCEDQLTTWSQQQVCQVSCFREKRTDTYAL